MGSKLRDGVNGSSHQYDPAFTDRVIAATGPQANRRLAEIMPSLVRHLHDFARETDITVAEWAAGVEFVSNCLLPFLYVGLRVVVLPTSAPFGSSTHRPTQLELPSQQHQAPHKPNLHVKHLHLTPGPIVPNLGRSTNAAACPQTGATKRSCYATFWAWRAW
jgi:hypothetical protein